MRQNTLTPEKRRILIRLQRWNQLREYEWAMLIDPAITDAILDEDSPEVSVLVLRNRPAVAKIMARRWEYCPEDKPAGLRPDGMRHGQLMVPFLDELEVCEQIEFRLIRGALAHAVQTFIPSSIERGDRVHEYSFHSRALQFARQALSQLREQSSNSGEVDAAAQFQEELA